MLLAILGCLSIIMVPKWCQSCQGEWVVWCQATCWCYSWLARTDDYGTQSSEGKLKVWVWRLVRFSFEIWWILTLWIQGLPRKKIGETIVAPFVGNNIYHWSKLNHYEK